MTLLHLSELSESLRISNGTNLKCFDLYDLLMLYKHIRVVPDTLCAAVKCVDNL